MRAPDIIYTPESQLRNPRALLRGMRQDSKAAGGLAWRLFIRDLKASYRRSILGVLWAFIPPIITAIVFVMLNRSKIIDAGDTGGVPYPVFVMWGTILWGFFIKGLRAPMKSLGRARTMFAKINFPAESLMLSQLAHIAYNGAIKLSILVGVIIVFKVPITWGLLLSPLAILSLVMLGMVIGMFLAPLAALYTDISAALTGIVGLWFFITPIAYQIPSEGAISTLAKYNPVTPLLVSVRDLATTGSLTNAGPFFLISVCALLGVLVMWVIYRVSLPILVERTSS